MPEFEEVVQKAWKERIDHTEPYQVLYHKLKRLHSDSPNGVGAFSRRQKFTTRPHFW